MRSPRRFVPRVHPLAARRLSAYGIDMASYLGIAVATVPIGLLVRRRRPRLPEAAVHALGAIPPVAATVWAAAAESSAVGATPGKRRSGLCVRTDRGGRLPAARSLLRASAKVLVPWLAGHTAAIHAAHLGDRDPDALLWGSGAIAYASMATGVLLTVFEPGRPLHDRLCGSQVVEAATD
jgi:uncharacterized RDD family membrane protein YckC